MTTTDTTVKALDKALLLAEMAASLEVRLQKVNGLLTTLQTENRQPTDAEFQAVYDDYDQARAKLLSDADLIDKVNGEPNAG